MEKKMRFHDFYCFLPRIGLFLILLSCPLYFSGWTHAVQLVPFEKVSAFHSQGSWPASAMINYAPPGNYGRNTTTGTGWGNDGGNLATGGDPPWHTISGSSLVGDGGVTFLENVNNIAVFSLAEDMIFDTSNQYLWINIDFLYGQGHQVRDFRLYVTDADSGTTFAVGPGDDNAKNSLATITQKFGTADIWQPLTTYTQSYANNGFSLNFGEGVSGEIRTSGTDRNLAVGFYLLAEIPEDITRISGLKLEVLLNNGNGPGAGMNPDNANYVLTNFRMGTVSAALFSEETSPIGYTRWANTTPESERYPLSDLNNVVDLNPRITLVKRDRGGVGYDFGGFWTVDEITFRAEGNFDSLEVYTSAGSKKFEGTDLVPGSDGLYTLNLDGISTSYLFIQPNIAGDSLNTMKIGNLDISTTGDFSPWENLAYKKEVTLKGNSGLFHQDWTKVKLTDGEMDLSFVSEGNGNIIDAGFVDNKCVYIQGNPGDAWIELNLGEAVWVNTLGLFQNIRNDRRILESFRLDFWNEGDAESDWQTFVFSTTPGAGDYLFYESMYQQMTFDDVFAQYMRLTPMGFDKPDNWWGVAEIQLFHKLPEPATWGMMLFGIAAGAFYAWRRRKSTVK